VSKSSLMSGQSFLDEHRAILMPDGSGWALRYPVASYEYGSRLEESVGCEIPIGTRNYDVALMIAEVILREHVAPRAPVPEVPLWTPPALSTGRHMFLGRKAA
jgi:hypothetical protein